MKIFGIGTDIVNIKRMKKTLKGKNNNFKKTCTTFPFYCK